MITDQQKSPGISPNQVKMPTVSELRSDTSVTVTIRTRSGGPNDVLLTPKTQYSGKSGAIKTVDLIEEKLKSERTEKHVSQLMHAIVE